MNNQLQATVTLVTLGYSLRFCSSAQHAFDRAVGLTLAGPYGETPNWKVDYVRPSGVFLSSTGKARHQGAEKIYLTSV